MDCKRVEENLPFYFYEELPEEERAALEAHLKDCPRCAGAAAELGRLRAVLDQRPLRQPSPELLVQSRQDLEEALDREAQSWRAMVRSWLVVPPGVSALRATTALAILTVGFSLGWTLQQRSGARGPVAPAGSAPWIGADMNDLHISGISRVAPDPQTGGVRITLDAERRVTLEGSLDDPRIQQVLVTAVKSYDNPGIRRDTLDVLQGAVGNPAVRDALLYALVNDRNAGVRLEAMAAAREMRCGADLHRALLHAVEQDTNPGVRVLAVDVLTEHAAAENDQELLQALKRLAASEANSYVRMKCAKAVQGLERDEF